MDRGNGTGWLPWNEPNYTGNPEAYGVARARKARADRLASTAQPWICPRCGDTSPGVTVAGRPRRACRHPACRAAAMAAASRDQGTHRQEHLSPGAVAAIREAYWQGVIGYRTLAGMYGCDRTTVRDIVTGRTHRSDASPLPPVRVLPTGGPGQVPCGVRSLSSHNSLKSFDRGNDGED